MENLYKKKKNPLSKLQSPTLIDKSAKKKKRSEYRHAVWRMPEESEEFFHPDIDLKRWN